MTLALTRASAPRRTKAPIPWRPAADRLHGRLAVAVLSGIALVCLASPSISGALRDGGGALLLVGGALIGVPHGSSDFVVAHRLMRPAFGRAWLFWFLAGYLALVAVTMAGWAVAPTATLVVFLAVSALHFCADDAGSAAASDPSTGARAAVLFAVRATTPVLPIFLIHPAGVASLIAALAGTSPAATLHWLDALRWPWLPLWAAALALVALPPLLARQLPHDRAGHRSGERVGTVRALDALELLSIALAAVVLPPLVAFALYFCLVHAVRHMLDIAADHHPVRAAAAAGLAAAIVLPSALACLVVLWFAWDGLAGLLDTDALVTWGLRIVAALTVPHMALERWAARVR